jgi:acyl carrier protein
MDDMTERIRGLISQTLETTVPVDNISDQGDLFKFGMDSISAIKLIFAIESEFGFEFNDEDLNMDNVKTITNIAEYICNRINHE